MISIKEYISMVYGDFKKYVDETDNLCILKTLNYQAGQKPDYTDVHIQQLYLLRYAFAYAFEYKSIFETLFEREEFKNSIQVTSIGCGNMIDYWGLVIALDEIENGDCQIKYRGIDIIDWNYKIEARKQDEVCFTRVNAGAFFTKTDALTSNVYVFPKSISEFSNDEFKAICEGFGKKEIQKDKMHILISLRADQGSMSRDMERSEALILAMGKNGFITDDVATIYYHYEDEDRGIKKLDNRFGYPDEALVFLASLNEKCSAYIRNGENCADDCKNLQRSPILKAKNIRYQVLSFARKGSI